MCLRARLRLESHPQITGDNPPPFYWNLPGEPIGNRQLHLRLLRVLLQVVELGTNHRPISPNWQEMTGPMLDAVVSTGEPLSIMPRWCRDLYGIATRIIWLEPRHVYDPARPPLFPGYPGPASWYFRDQHPFELGLIWAIASDSESPPHQLCPRPIVARFLTEPSPDIPEPIIGLGWSILTNRRLTRETIGHDTGTPFQPEEWWLSEPF